MTGLRFPVAAWAALGVVSFGAGCGFGGSSHKAPAASTAGVTSAATSTTTSGTTTNTSTYMTDVKPILKAKQCDSCHATLVPNFKLSPGLTDDKTDYAACFTEVNAAQLD